jgi:hypothetical protein
MARDDVNGLHVKIELVGKIYINIDTDMPCSSGL